jgi:SAM-dependent methyltransferase
MSYIELKKRRARRLAETPLEALADLTLIPIEQPVELETPAAPPIQAVLEAPAPVAAPVVEALTLDHGLLKPVLNFIQRSQDVVVLGMGPWGDREWAEALMIKARGVTVVDPDKSRLNTIRAYCHHTVTAGFENPAWASRLGAGRYDVAIIGQGLTHLADPMGFLRQVKEILSPGGAILAVVPNVGYGESALNLLKGEYPRDFEPSAPLHHYTRARLREVFAYAGYALVEVYAHEQALFGPTSELVPELFPEALLTAIHQEDDFSASHFVVKATPTAQDVLLRQIFEEQDQLR